MATPTEVQLTIADQINAGILSRRGIKLYIFGENTVALKKGNKTMKITYNFGSDLYSVTVSSFNKKTFDTKEETFEGVFAEDLEETIDRHFKLKGFVSDVRSLRSD